MKKSLVARGFIGAVASLLGVVAVGCSAEGYDDGQVASQSQNLGNAAPSVTTTGIAQFTPDSESTAGQQDPNVLHAATCKIWNSDHYDLVVAGGFKDNGSSHAALDKIFVYNPVANSWTWLGASSGPALHVARGDLQGIPLPDDNTKCAFVGGATSYTSALKGVASKAVDILTVSGGSYTIANGTDLNTARSNFALSTCGNQLIAFGGQDNGTRLASVEYSNNSSASAAWTNTTGLTTARMDFAFAKKPGEDKYLIAGGDFSGGVSKQVTLITASSCATTVTNLALSGTSQLTVARSGSVAFSITGDDFFVAGGANGSSVAVANVDKVSVSAWTGTPAAAVAADTALNTATYQPTLVQSYSGTNPAFMLIGGLDAPLSASGNSVAKVMQWQKLYGWHNATPVTRYAGGAQELDGAVYIASGGSVASGVDTKITTNEGVTP